MRLTRLLSTDANNTRRKHERNACGEYNDDNLATCGTTVGRKRGGRIVYRSRSRQKTSCVIRPRNSLVVRARRISAVTSGRCSGTFRDRWDHNGPADGAALKGRDNDMSKGVVFQTDRRVCDRNNKPLPSPPTSLGTAMTHVRVNIVCR